MNKKTILVLLVILIIIVVGIAIFAISKSTITNDEEKVNIASDSIKDNENSIESNSKIGESNTENVIISDTTENNQDNTEGIENMKLYIDVNDRTLTATLNDNSSTKELINKLKDGPITIEMEDYSSMEKVGSLGFSLPRNDESINTEAGDLILYQGNSFVIYYDNNSWSLTRLGKIDNISQKELKEILGTGSVKVTLYIQN